MVSRVVHPCLCHLCNSSAWEWEDGSAFDFDNWAPNDPNYLETQHCTVLEMAMSWNNIPCDENAGYICKWEIGWSIVNLTYAVTGKPWGFHNH